MVTIGMRGIGKIVDQHLDAHVREGAADQARDVAVVLEEFLGVVGDAFGMVFRAELFVGALVFLAHLGADIVLVADEDELPGGARVAVAQEMMHAEAEILEAELREFLRRRDIGIEVVFGERPALQAPALAETADKEPRRQKHRRRHDILRQSADPFGTDHGTAPASVAIRSLGEAPACVTSPACVRPPLRYEPTPDKRVFLP